MKTLCDFGHISTKNVDILRKLLALAILETEAKSPAAKNDLLKSFTKNTEIFSLNSDDKKLLWLEFLELLNTPQEDLERKYLETIFNLEDDEKLEVHLTDFIENAHI